ncbi:hypothetical protein D3C75_1095780 [compost metagenome]
MYNVSVGLKLLSGLKRFTLQGVMQLSFENIFLRHEMHNDKNVFVLQLSQIKLSFLGLRQLPPNGATSLKLFGDPNGNNDSHSELGWYAMFKS